MRIVTHLTKSYDWMPVPPDTVVTPNDVAQGRARLDMRGGYRMRVIKNGRTHITTCLSEEQIVAKIIHEKCRPSGGRVLTRAQAIAFYLGEEVLQMEASPSWIEGFEVHDDQHEKTTALLGSKLEPMLACGRILGDENDAHHAAYMEDADAKAIEAHLMKHFRVKAAS